MIKVTKHGKTYEVTEEALQKEIHILEDALKMKKQEVDERTQDEILESIARYEEKIAKLKSYDNDTIAHQLIYTIEDAEILEKQRKELGIAKIYDELFKDDDGEDVYDEPIKG